MCLLVRTDGRTAQCVLFVLVFFCCCCIFVFLCLIVRTGGAHCTVCSVCVETGVAYFCVFFYGVLCFCVCVFVYLIVKTSSAHPTVYKMQCEQK